MGSAEITGRGGPIFVDYTPKEVIKPVKYNPSEREPKSDRQVLLFKKPRRR
jgi:hypothetical protein